MSSTSDPFATLGLEPGADPAAIRRAYLELVRKHPPERDPERFAAIRAAYDLVRDPVVRLTAAVIGQEDPESPRVIAEDVRKSLLRARLPLATILKLATPGRPANA